MNKIEYTTWAVRVRINGTWSSVLNDNDAPMQFGGRTGFERAKAAARREWREMRGAHMTAVVRVGDEDCGTLHRTAENDFTL
ncbi:MAG: hypothetical protein EBR82_68565 [Caulobacteraceae bacterium]|nr:hypothetical protein [Caulobacteraceae bacterium]